MTEHEPPTSPPESREASANERLAERLSDLSHFIAHLTWENQSESARASLAVAAETMRAAASALARLAVAEAPLSPPLSPGRSANPPADPSVASTERLKTGEKTRIEFAGRVAHPPRFEISRKNHVHLLRFSVLEYDGEEQTYHQVLAFNALADRYRDKLAKDEFVRVIGYPHIRRGRARDGSPKEFPEVYATAIRKR